MDFDHALGRLIAEWRQSAGLSQQALGAAVALDQAAISRIESGDRKVDVELLLHIVAASGLRFEKEAPRIADLSPEIQAKPLWEELQ